MADYHNLPEKLIFLSDKPRNGCIYLHEQLVHNELFPLRSVVPKGHIPRLYAVLRRNVSIDHHLMGQDDVKKEIENEEKLLE